MDKTIEPRMHLIEALKEERKTASVSRLPFILAELSALQVEQHRRLERVLGAKEQRGSAP